ncbi:MAG: hypothetical protein GY861_00145 [bacterium]|nr:hypothetical protein [bacterium]
MVKNIKTHEIRCSQKLKKKNRAGELRDITCGRLLAHIVIDPNRMELHLSCKNCKKPYVIDLKPSYANYSVRKVDNGNPDLTQKEKEKQNA